MPQSAPPRPNNNPPKFKLLGAVRLICSATIPAAWWPLTTRPLHLPIPLIINAFIRARQGSGGMNTTWPRCVGRVLTFRAVRSSGRLRRQKSAKSIRPWPASQFASLRGSISSFRASASCVIRFSRRARRIASPNLEHPSILGRTTNCLPSCYWASRSTYHITTESCNRFDTLSELLAAYLHADAFPAGK